MHAIQGPGQLIEAVVPLLGFEPVESLVAVSVSGGVLASVMRLDLRDAVLDGAADRLAGLAVRNGADGVVVVIVSAEAVSCAQCGERFQDLARELGMALGGCGVRLLDSLVVDRIAAGGRWRCVDDYGVGGVLADPATSVMGAVAVAEGHRQYGTREELKAMVAVDAERAAVLAPLLSGAVNVAVSGLAAVAAVRRMAGGVVLSDAELAGVGAALVEGQVRDVLYSLAACDEAAAAEGLWALLARVLPAPFRVEALTLTAFSSYLRGDGPLAGVALEAALAEDPGHRMAGMLDTARRNGIRPEQIRQLLAGVPSAV
jgi:Domain of unknown function (DUF4192)